jgi:hypothetical protein
MMPPCGTFDYVTTVPKNSADSSSEWEVRLRSPVKQTGSAVSDHRLVGYAPRLQITDVGLTPDPGPQRPSVMRSRLTLTAASSQDATVSAISFHVDRDLISLLQPGDDLHMARTSCAALGLSMLRRGRLLAAVGAVTGVPLGDDFQAQFPFRLVEKASAVFAKADPEFEFREIPIEFVEKKHRRILFHGPCRLGQYGVFMWHGFLPGMPGTNESAAICEASRQVPAFASLSAQLLEADPAGITRWPNS